MTIVYDPTGILADNHIINEVHSIIAEPDLYPINSPVYKAGFTITGIPVNSSTPIPLNLYTDYMWSPLFAKRSEDTGKEVYSYILLTNWSEWSSVTISYHAVGGEPDYILNSEILANGAFDRSILANWLGFVGDVSDLIASGINLDFSNSSLAMLFSNKLDAIIASLDTPSTYISFLEGDFLDLQIQVEALKATMRSWNTSLINNDVAHLVLLTEANVAAAIHLGFDPIEASLSNYITIAALGNFPGHTGHTAGILDNYELISSLGNQVQVAVDAAIAALNGTASYFVTTEYLLQTLANYVLISTLNANLANYVTIASVPGRLANYVLISSLSAYETIVDFDARLTGYVKITDLATLLNNYVTLTSLTTTFQQYVTNTAMPIYVNAQVANMVNVVRRTRLTGNLNLYVSTTGSDSNNGLTSVTPFLTRQKAWDTVMNHYDLCGYTVNIQCAGGTYTEPFNPVGVPIGLTDPSNIKIYGVAAPTVVSNTSTSTNNGWVANAAYPKPICDCAVGYSTVYNYIIVAGGISTSDGSAHDIADVYLGITDSTGAVSWTQTTSLPVAMSDISLFTVNNIAGGGQGIIVIDGFGRRTFFGHLVGTTITWVLGTALPTSLGHTFSFNIHEGNPGTGEFMFWVHGQSATALFGQGYFATAQISWAAGGQLPLPLNNGSIVALGGGTLICVCPNIGPQVYLGQVNVNTSPATCTINWGLCSPDYPGTHAANVALAALDANHFVAINGDNITKAYTCAVNNRALTWTQLTNYPITPLSDITAIPTTPATGSVGYNIVAIGGDAGASDDQLTASIYRLVSTVSTTTTITNTTTGMAVFSGNNYPAIAANNAQFTLQNVVLQVQAGNYNSLDIKYNSTVLLDAGVVFGSTVGGSHLSVSYDSLALISKPYIIMGGAVNHLQSNAGGVIRVAPATGVAALAVTLAGVPAFSGAYANANKGVITLCDALIPTFTGTATGKRYSVTLGGVISVNGNGTAYLPGNSAGTYDATPSSYYN